MPGKILIIPARRHIIESYSEYLIRYLSDEFYFEMGYPPEVPYDTMRARISASQISPFHKNPDDFDLIYPHFDSHWFLVPKEKYVSKIATVILEPAGPWGKVAVVGGTSPSVEAGLTQPFHSLRFGVDTEMFKPYPMERTDDLLHVGFIGNVQTPRRYIKELFMTLKDLPGVRLMIFPTTWSMNTRPDEIEGMGGVDMVNSIVDGDKWITGLPNIYNQMDVFIRADIDHGYQFSINEAAACGVPVICTDSGNSKQICDSGGGICIDNGEARFTEENLNRISQEIRTAVEFMRDNPEERKDMGKLARLEIERNWTWDKHINNWREFFREGLQNAM